MKIEIIVAVVGIFGILIGAVIQYYLGSRAEQAKHYRQLRTVAYVDFINAICSIAIAQKFEPSNEQKSRAEISATVLLADSKARIAIYGSRKVAVAVAHLFRNHEALSTPNAMRDFVSVVAKIRSETPGGELAVPPTDIGQMLFGQEV